ncbi:SH3 domain-containing protein [Candidatus Thiothrix anitrata]|uniref:SH3 domain-containing protein n=1 Tax=Candidatus Thiothrix anitrata TaxID=2823902 RepID=A0ABX7X598_9GAMM|nr:SH3 domain-containing protein [Candidatus Thiothrix anitrata]QTR51055.1 SH3 domain-containing protein [Candidatus Thiothrix anitrata]
MKPHFLTLSLTAMLAFGAVNIAYATADGPDFYAVTRVAGTDTLALRDAPSSRGKILARIPFNAVRVKNEVERRSGWCKVQYARTLGWVGCKHLTESDGNRYYSTQGYTDRLNIRKTPSTSAAVVGTIPPLETGLQGTGECSASWCPVDYQGKRGWVGRRYLASWSF